MSTLRQRRRVDEEEKPRAAPRVSLEAFDLYTKVAAEESVSTTSGGTVSIIASVICVILTLSELRGVVFPSTREHMVVDPVVEDRLRVNFDITFHAIPCSEANLDAMDVAGEQQNGIDTDIAKTRVGTDGVPIGAAFAHVMESEGSHAEATPLPADYCGSCYGAASREGQCCNSCDDVRAAYAERGWDIGNVTSNAEQCVREHKHPVFAAKPGEGCRLTGFMTVNKVAGNFHVAMGETHTRGAGHIHQFNPSSIGTYNTSHTVHYLSFGEPYPGMKNPLDNVKKVVPTGSGVFMYFIKIVPTVYDKSGESSSAALALAARRGGAGSTVSAARNVLKTNQYSVTSQFRPAVVMGGRLNVLPGVFFVYDVSPFMVTVTQHRTSIWQFLTSVFAILGGVLTLATAIDAAVYHIARLRKHPASAALLSMIAPAEKGGLNGASAAAALFRGSTSTASQPAPPSASPAVTSPTFYEPNPLGSPSGLHQRAHATPSAFTHDDPYAGTFQAPMATTPGQYPQQLASTPASAATPPARAFAPPTMRSKDA